jgi:hypothetical protein
MTHHRRGKPTLDTGSESLGVTEAEDTSVVDLGLDEGGVVLDT